MGSNLRSTVRMILLFMLLFVTLILANAMGGHGSRQGNNSIAVSPDNTRIAVAFGSEIRPIRIIALPSEQVIASIPVEYSVSDLSFSPDSKLLAVGLGIADEPPEGVIKVWDIASQSLLGEIDTPNTFITQFKEDSNIILYDEFDKIFEWDILDRTSKITTLKHMFITHSSDPQGSYVAANGNKKIWVSAKHGVNEPLNIHSSTDDALLKQIPLTGTVGSLFFNNSGDQLAILLKGELLEALIYSTNRWSLEKRIQLESKPGEGTFCPSGRYLYVLCSDNMVYYWDLESDRFIGKFSVLSANEKFLIAAAEGNLATLREQISLGADVNIIDSNRKANALMLASEMGHAEIVETLIAAGADVNLATLDGKTALYFAEGNNFRDIAEILENAGTASISVSTKSRQPRTEQFIDTSTHESEQIQNDKTAVESEMDISTTDVHTYKALDAGAEFHPKSFDRPLLVDAAYYGQNTIVEDLISTGADVNLTGYFFSPLSAASRQGHTETVRTLLLAGAKINASGKNALCEAAGRGHSEIVELLLKNGADVNDVNGSNYSPLYFAVSRKDFNRHYFDIVKLLIEAGADPNIHPDSGPTPLMAAVQTGSLELVEYLLQHGADVNTVAKRGYTALVHAVLNDYKDIEDLLREYGSED